jgi:hypothetical protein
MFMSIPQSLTVEFDQRYLVPWPTDLVSVCGHDIYLSY